MSSLESERHSEVVEPHDVRDAILALALLPPVLFVRYSVDVLEAAGKLVSGLIDASPLRGPVLQLDRRWRTRLGEAGAMAEKTFDASVAWALDHVDPAAILDKVDVNQIVSERVDVDAIISRVDVVSIARHVIDELDLPEIVRDSSQTMAAETVDGLRRQGMNADRSLSEFIDRVLGRKPGRGEAAAGPSPGVGQPT